MSADAVQPGLYTTSCPSPPLPGSPSVDISQWDDAPVLFLDFDGVTHPEGAGQKRLFEHLPAIESVLLAHPQVRVVVSSTWRLLRPVEELRRLFNPLLARQIVGKTPWIDDGHAFPRERECIQWLRSHAAPWTTWVALDDRPWLFRPFCPQLITVPWKGRGIEPAQLEELDSRLRAAT